jgi:ABC-type amino acid transport substrate-binding protein
MLFFAVVVGVVVALTMNNNNPALAVAPTLPPTVMPPTVPATPSLTSVPSATPTTSAPSTIPPTVAPTQESVVPDTLERIQIANQVKCGVVERLGFATAAGIDRWTGMEVDLCKAIAAATLQNSNLVEIISLTQEDRFAALASGEIDILAGMTTFTMERDVHEVSNLLLILGAMPF